MLIDSKIKEPQTQQTFIDNEFSQEVFDQTYKFGDETIFNALHRVASALASKEKDKEYWTKKFFDILLDFKFVPGGRILSNAGTKLTGTTMINCFPAETNVLTSNGYKHIKDIQIGDEVLTHNGRFKKVVSLMQRQHEGELIEITTPHSKFPLRCSDEHPFFNSNNNWTISKDISEVVYAKKQDVDEILKIDLKDYTTEIDNVFVEDSKIFTSTTASFHNNAIVTKRSVAISRFIKIDEDFAYILGRFVGDGSTFIDGKYSTNTTSFNIAFNRKEQKELFKIKGILEKTLGLDIADPSESNCQYIRKYNVVFSNFLKISCGENVYTKKVPNFIWKSKNSVIRSFIKGLLDADSSVLGNSSISISLANEKLIKELQALLFFQNIPSKTSSGFQTIDGVDFEHTNLTISGFYSNQLKTELKKYYEDSRLINVKKDNGLNKFNFKSDLVYAPVEKTRIIDNTTLYNISVEEDESYVVEGIIVHNCFVDGFVGEQRDSMLGILSALQRQALILKSEGGYGFCADTMRPRGAFIHGIANESPGAVKMLEMWDKQSEVITEGSGKKSIKKKSKGKIRKGAQMVTMSCWHPDIAEYITAKDTDGRLEKFNMSVLITDDFIEAVELNKKWDLIFPDYESDMSLYDKEWNGNIKEWIAKGNPIYVYKTYEDANELWDLIMKSTYTRNEPGVLFIDTINRLNNLYYTEYISATNPCGEQVLPTGGVCLLGSLNLTQFIDFEHNDWNYKKLEDAIPAAIRMMDNVNDLTYVPLEIQRENLLNKRRIGLGILGLGSALMMMKSRYGSEDALDKIDKLMSFMANTSYQTSALLAQEKGAFPLYDEEKYMQSKFIDILSEDTLDMIRKYGIRNSHLLSIQPTGNTSSLANAVSSGLEPVFLQQYIRTAIVPHKPKGMKYPEAINWKKATANNMGNWMWIKEGDTNLLAIAFDDDKYKLDQNRGLTKENLVVDFGVKYLKEHNQYDETADWCVDTSKLTIDDHISTMTVISKYIDSAMSKTINLPEDYSYEDFKNVYYQLHKSGTVKGCTTYREGTMTTVLAEIQKGIPKTHAPKRPKDLECDIHHLTVKGMRWIVLVGLIYGDPYEVFAFKQKSLHLPNKMRNGVTRKVKSGIYDLMDDADGEGLVINDIKEFFERDEEEALTRLISTALRHGADVKYIIEQLNKSEGTVISFSKAIARTLKKYLKEDDEIKVGVCESCDSSKIRYEDGCVKCLDCGHSKCL